MSRPTKPSTNLTAVYSRLILSHQQFAHPPNFLDRQGFSEKHTCLATLPLNPPLVVEEIYVFKIRTLSNFFNIQDSSFQEEKIYVQHRLKENSEIVWDYIEKQKAWCYLAGYV